MTAAFMPVRVWKEVRGLTPAWLAAVAVMVGAGFGDKVRAVGVLAYLIGAIALGALSMGHEYSGRTLSLLLSQPSRREGVLLRKFGVLSAMMLTLAAIAWASILPPNVMAGASPDRMAAWRGLGFGLPLLCGLFLAPWLTMVCRNALAGIVFSIAIPGMMWVASEFASTFVYGAELSTLPEAGALTFNIFWRGMLVVSVVAAISTWRMFMRLEAVESRSLDLHLPSWLFLRSAEESRTTRSTRGVSRLLVAKELRLQQLTFAVSGLYLAGWLGLALFGAWLPQPQYRTIMMTTLTMLHAWAIPLLAGSLASAEERQLGTLGWQVLLPVSAWHQWALKAALAVALSLGLAIGLPAVVSLLTASIDARMARELGPLFTWPIASAVTAIAMVSLYVSSLSANGLRALLVSLPVAVGLSGLANTILVLQMRLRLFERPMMYPELFGSTEKALFAVLLGLLVLFFLGALGMLWRFGMTNHRSAERGAARVWTQLGWMVGTLSVAFAIWFGIAVVYANRVERIQNASLERMKATSAAAVFEVQQGGTAITKDAIVILFWSVPGQAASRAPFNVVTANAQGRFEQHYLPATRTSSAVAISNDGGSVLTVLRDLGSKPELREQLKERATPFKAEPGKTAAVTLELTRLPLSP